MIPASEPVIEALRRENEELRASLEIGNRVSDHMVERLGELFDRARCALTRIRDASPADGSAIAASELAELEPLIRELEEGRLPAPAPASPRGAPA